DASLIKQRSEVTKHISSRINEVQKTLNKKFDKITANIDIFRKQKATHLKNIEDAVKAADKLAEDLLATTDRGFEKKYKDVIAHLFTEIKDKVEDFTGSDSGKSTELLTNFNTVKVEVGKLEGKVRHGLEELKRNIEKLADDVYDNESNILVRDALRALQQAKRKLVEAHGKASAPSNSLLNKYSGAAGRFHEQFEILIKGVEALNTSAVTSEMNTLASAVGVQLERLKDIHTTVKGEVDEKFGNLKNTLSSQIQALKDAIKSQLQEYVKKFGEGGDNNSWQNSDLNKCLTEARKFLGKSAVVDLIDAIKTNGQKIAEYLIAQIKDGDIESLADNAAKEGTKRYQDALGMKINGESGTGDLTGGIKGEIQKEMDKLKHPNKNGQGFQKAFSNFEKALEAVRQSSKPVKIAETDVQNQVYALIAAVESLGNSINDFDEAANERIKDVAEKAIVEAANTIGASNGDIDVKTLMTQFDSAKSAMDQAVQQIQKELTELQTLPNTVDKNRENTNLIMAEVKSRIEEIKKEITAINQPIEAAQSALESAIGSIENVLKDTRQTAMFEFAALQGNLRSRVNECFDEIEEYIQKMFAKEKNVEFLSLKNSIVEEIPIIRNTINEDTKAGLKGLMNKLSDVIAVLKGADTNLSTYSNWVKSFYEKFLTSLQSQPDLSDHSPRLTPLTGALSALLSTMHDHKHFSAAVSRKLADLQTQLVTLTPSAFSQASPLLNVVKAGVQAFHGELAKQYVSRYSGERFTDEVVKDKPLSNPKTVIPPAKAVDNTEITEYRRKCAKVFLTLLDILSHGFYKMATECPKLWKGKQINTYEENAFGKWLEEQGYELNSEGGKQHGELQDKREMKGQEIYEKLLTKKLENLPQVDFAKWKTEMIRQNKGSNRNIREINV
ncbi:hypothetical protein, conserved, partial [Babesia bigemina]